LLRFRHTARRLSLGEPRGRRDGAIRQALYCQPDEARHSVPAVNVGMELA